MFGAFQCDVFQPNAFQNVCGEAQGPFPIGHPVYIYRRKRKKSGREELRDIIESVVEELREETPEVQVEAARIIAPEASPRHLPAVVDYGALAARAERVERLIALWARERDREFEEDIIRLYMEGFM